MPLEHYPAELMGMGDEFDEFFNSPVNFSGSDTSENQFLGQGRSDIAKLLIPNDSGLEPRPGKYSGELSNTAKTTSPNIWSLSSSDTGESRASGSCSCLIQALDIMKKILANENMNSLQQSSGEHATKISKDLDIPFIVPSAQNVVTENKQTLEALTPMLQCSCGEDGYLLMVLSMIVFRILGRYAAAALQPPIEDGEKGDRSSMSISTKEYKKRLNNIDVDGEESRRMAAQLILRELHRVLRLINELSLRLQAHGRGSTSHINEGFSVEKIFGWESKTPTLSDHLTKAAPFSAARFAQLEVDMRKCLNTLSSEIINMLQHI
ncbi:hypothetical protein EYC80_003960 [Monilinia laxa]|uniref:Aflatoxin regulatory protein domain-containing protein n=1 Tax=Monilinia laxa TaxID=61186 RepID=A0A5N6KLT3_MONLA|nr:hypothetical protein EYC80_003960 [Monilinia laxa]